VEVAKEQVKTPRDGKGRREEIVEIQYSDVLKFRFAVSCLPVVSCILDSTF
jgi:hypothetical protein